MAQNEPIFNGLNGYKLFRMCKSSGGGITFKGAPGAMACLPRNEQLLGIEAAKRVQTLFRSRDWAEFVNNSVMTKYDPLVAAVLKLKSVAIIFVPNL